MSAAPLLPFAIACPAPVDVRLLAGFRRAHGAKDHLRRRAALNQSLDDRCDAHRLTLARQSERSTARSSAANDRQKRQRRCAAPAGRQATPTRRSAHRRVCSQKQHLRPGVRRTSGHPAPRFAPHSSPMPRAAPILARTGNGVARRVHARSLDLQPRNTGKSSQICILHSVISSKLSARLRPAENDDRPVARHAPDFPFSPALTDRRLKPRANGIEARSRVRPPDRGASATCPARFAHRRSRAHPGCPAPPMRRQRRTTSSRASRSRTGSRTEVVSDPRGHMILHQPVETERKRGATGRREWPLAVIAAAAVSAHRSAREKRCKRTSDLHGSAATGLCCMDAWVVTGSTQKHAEIQMDTVDYAVRSGPKTSVPAAQTTRIHPG